MPAINVEPDGTAREDNALIPSVSITALMKQRAAMLERFEQVFQLLDEAWEIAQASGLGFPEVTIAQDFRGHRMAIAGQMARPVEARRIVETTIDAQGWTYLLDQSGMKSIMSVAKRHEFQRQVNNNKMPPLTLGAVTDTFTALHESRREMFENGVIECYRSLSWKYSTNNPVQFGKRIIVSYLTERC